MPFLSWLLKNVVLDWLFSKLKSWYENYVAKKARDEKIEEEVKEDIEAIKKAETEEERTKAIEDLAKRF